MFVWDILFPARCFNCGYVGVYVCPRCAGRLKPRGIQTCLYCKKPSLWGLTHPSCSKVNGIDGFLSLYYYGGVFKKIIKGIKYSLVREASGELYYLVAREAANYTTFFRKFTALVVVSIPLSGQRKRSRGFNQAQYVSMSLSHLLQLPVDPILERVRDTAPQAQREKRERRENVRGAFRVRAGAVVPEKVLLVDDIVTTGETVKGAAKTLKKSGVAKVFVFSVAKG